MELFRVFMKGMWIGGTLTVPGVSGGTMAMVLGIYERLIESINLLLKKGAPKRKSLKFILVFTLGGLSGILAISGAIVALLKKYPLPMAFLFAGAVLGGMRVILREINGSILRGGDVIYPLSGLAVVLSIAALPEDLIVFGSGGPLQWLLQMAVGVVAAGALVLPGISISQVLYVLGMYEVIMVKISGLDFVSLIPFGSGLILGIICITKVLEDLLVRFHKESYLVTLGFIIGSIIQLLKSAPFEGFGLNCLLLLVIGFVPIFMISKKKKDQS